VVHRCGSVHLAVYLRSSSHLRSYAILSLSGSQQLDGSRNLDKFFGKLHCRDGATIDVLAFLCLEEKSFISKLHCGDEATGHLLPMPSPGGECQTPIGAKAAGLYRWSPGIPVCQEAGQPRKVRLHRGQAPGGTQLTPPPLGEPPKP
jgi:hypothetical protein